MSTYRIGRAVLLIYECIRLLILVILFILASPETSSGGTFFPYITFFSPNALFLLAALFVWLRPMDYRNFLSLYMAGKIISVLLFFAWGHFTDRRFSIEENMAINQILLLGSTFLNLADILSIGGAWFLNIKYRESSGGE